MKGRGQDRAACGDPLAADRFDPAQGGWHEKKLRLLAEAPKRRRLLK
jgi:hypothetical protein